MKKACVLLPALVLAAVPLFARGESQTPGGAGVQTQPGGGVSYPLETNVTLTYWTALTYNLQANFTNMGDTPYAKAWEQKTGVKVRYLHPPIGGENEQFNLMVASGELPDIIDRDFLAYPGGPEKAISDGVITNLNDTLARHAPNLAGWLKAHPDYDRMVKTDEGNYYVFPFMRGDVGLCIWQGIQIRKDWLDELGLAVPQTYDDWRNVLTAFKQRKNSPAPLCIPWNNTSFLYGYGVDRNFFVGADGKVQYGSTDPAFREYLEMMAQWYREGLLDPDMATLSAQQIQTRIASGVSGAFHGSLGGNMGAWTPAARQTTPQFELLAVKGPTKQRGQEPILLNIDNPYYGANSAAISGASRNVEIAARLLDYNYGQEGYMFNNFGVEGVSYNMINGYPTFTDLVMRNPQGWPVSQAMSAHVRSSYGGPMVQAIEYFQQYMALPEQKAGPDNWAIKEPFKHRLPPITPTPEESREFAQIMNEINTYTDEMITKFILGTEPLSSWDTFVSTIRRMGIDRALAIQNAALTRYNRR
ncbi:MAG: extracellular solute-binding protein [Treponema sp.]|nr:extracellular solute-binding protein [Treponema sp.]